MTRINRLNISRATHFRNGAEIYQKCYRPVYGYWVMLARLKSGVYTTCRVDSTGKVLWSEKHANGNLAESAYLNLISETTR